MKRTLERNARDLVAAFDRGEDISPLVDALRVALAAERFSATERAKVSLFRKMTPEQRAERVRKAQSVLDLISSLE